MGKRWWWRTLIFLRWVLEEENTYPKSDRFYVKGESDVKAEKVKNARKKSPVRIGRLRKDSCSHCGGKMMDMLTVDGREERLRFLVLGDTPVPRSFTCQSC